MLNLNNATASRESPKEFVLRKIKRGSRLFDRYDTVTPEPLIEVCQISVNRAMTLIMKKLVIHCHFWPLISVILYERISGVR